MLKVYTFLFVVLMLTGCNGCANEKTKIDTTTPLGNSIAKTEVYIGEATGDVNAAKPHADQVGKVHLDSATTSLGNATKEVKSAQTELAQVKAQNDDLKATISAQEQTIDAYHHRWLGDQTIKWAKIIVAVWLGLGILGVVLQTYTGGIFGVIGGQILHLLPISNLFAGAAAWLARPKAG